MAGPVFKMSFDMVKRGFFDRQAVVDAMDKTTLKVFRTFGGRVRKTAKNSIKQTRQKARGMTALEKRNFNFARREAKREGRKPPKRPIVANPSLPGQPPQSITGLLKNMIFFSLDKDTRSVVTGPTKAGPATADVLEFGGTTRHTVTGKRIKIAARPYMTPAFDEAKTKLPKMWAEARAS